MNRPNVEALTFRAIEEEEPTYFSCGVIALATYIAALEAERDALHKDAERYRFLRDTGRMKIGPVIGPRDRKYRAIIAGISLGSVPVEIETLDEAIDAIAAKEQK